MGLGQIRAAEGPKGARGRRQKRRRADLGGRRGTGTASAPIMHSTRLCALDHRSMSSLCISCGRRPPALGHNTCCRSCALGGACQCSSSSPLCAVCGQRPANSGHQTCCRGCEVAGPTSCTCRLCKSCYSRPKSPGFEHCCRSCAVGAGCACVTECVTCGTPSPFSAAPGFQSCCR